MDAQNIENNGNIKYIESVSDFLVKIKEIGEKETLFYRGHSNEKKFELEPSIYRKDDKTNKLLYIENEDKIYRETIAKVPYDFNGKNTIESLVLMQHYGVPTRILDLTTNPLVALYFACDDDKNKDADGEVIVFDIPEESTCYFDSDRVTILANLAKCRSDFYYRKMNITHLKEYRDKIEKVKENNHVDSYLIELKKSVKIDDYIQDNFFLYPSEIQSLIDGIINCNFQSSLDEEKKQLKYILLEQLEEKINSLIWEEISSINQYYFRKLLCFIKDDKPYFEPYINIDDVERVLAIKPKLDNPRIVRQHGAFLIFGIKARSCFIWNKTISTKEMAKIPFQWIERGGSLSGNRIIIEKSKKELILKELDKLGINKSTLFPEIDKVADYIKEKYAQK